MCVCVCVCVYIYLYIIIVWSLKANTIKPVGLKTLLLKILFNGLIIIAINTLFIIKIRIELSVGKAFIISPVINFAQKHESIYLPKLCDGAPIQSLP